MDVSRCGIARLELSAIEGRLDASRDGPRTLVFGLLPRYVTPLHGLSKSVRVGSGMNWTAVILGKTCCDRL